MYPLAMGVDVSEGEYILTYAMPDLPRATGQGKEEEDGNQTLQVRGKSFEEIKSRYERSQEKISGYRTFADTDTESGPD